MDKNLINIDDLVRQRLSGGEEQERPGAWLNMREMLDKEMPGNGAAGAVNWRRNLSYMAGLLLLATASFGGYEMVSSFKAHGVEGTRPIASATGKAGSLGYASSKNSNAAIAEIRNDRAKSSEKITAHTAGEIAKKKAENADVSGSVGMSNKTDNQLVDNLLASSAPTPKARHAVSRNSTIRHLATVQPMPLAGNTNNGGATTTTGNAPDNESVIGNNTNDNSRQAKGAVAPDAKKIHTSTSGAKNVASAPAGTSAHTAGNKATEHSIAPAANVPVVATNSMKATGQLTYIDKLEIKYHYIKSTAGHPSFYKADTISKDRLSVLVHNLAAAPKTIPNQTLASNVPKQKLPGVAPEPLTSGMSNDAITPAEVTKKRKGGSSLGLLNFGQMIKELEYDFGHVKFRPGIIAGINGTFFGPNTLSGFQFGMTGNFVFNDQWDAMAEVKYVHRVNNSLEIKDNYSQYVQTSAGNWEKTAYQNYYTFSTLHSFELPISIRYTAGNFHVFAGGNLVYDLAINAGGGTYKSQPEPGNGAQPGNEEPTVNYNDFNSRFSLGYLLGAAYQVTPALMVDLRMTQNVWNNAKTKGEQIIANDVYKSPSLQLSVGYRLSGNSKKMGH